MLERPQARVIFLLRQPVDVLQSIVHMGTHLDANERNASVASATAYYRQSPAISSRRSRDGMGTRAVFIESEALMSRTEETLHFLQNFLDLETPLDRRYRHFPRTGRPGSGDPSDAIRSGEMRARRIASRVTRSRRRYIAEAVQAHAECFSACSLYCVSMRARPGAATAIPERVDLSLAG